MPARPCSMRGARRCGQKGRGGAEGDGCKARACMHRSLGLLLLHACMSAACPSSLRRAPAPASVSWAQWEAKTQLTQLTQQPPPETLATQQRDGGDDVQADIWEVCAKMRGSWGGMCVQPLLSGSHSHLGGGCGCVGLLVRAATPCSPGKRVQAESADCRLYTCCHLVTTPPLGSVVSPAQATQACIEVGQQLRDKQAALEEASEAWRASGATIADNKCAVGCRTGRAGAPFEGRLRARPERCLAPA